MPTLKHDTAVYLKRAVEAEISRPDCSWVAVREIADLIVRIDREQRLPVRDAEELSAEADAFLQSTFRRLQAEIDAEADDEDEPRVLFPAEEEA